MINNDVMISVVIPAYNCEKYIQNCLESILNQNMESIEIIVINDGSSDKTAEVVGSLVVQDKRIKLVNQVNAGPSMARNRGIEEAKGKFLCFVDADDIILPNMFEVMVKYYNEYKVDWIHCGYKKVQFNGSSYEESLQQMNKVYLYKNKEEILENFYDIVNKGINSPWGKLFLTSIIKENGIRFDSNLDMGEDFQFNIWYLDNINSMMFIPESFYQYNIFNSTLTFKYRENLFEERKKSVELYQVFLVKNKLDFNVIWYLYIKLMFADAMQEIEHSTKVRLRLENIRGLLKRDEIQKAIDKYKGEGVIGKTLLFVAKTKSVYLIDFVSFVLVKIRRSGKVFANRISI